MKIFSFLLEFVLNKKFTFIQIHVKWYLFSQKHQINDIYQVLDEKIDLNKHNSMRYPFTFYYLVWFWLEILRFLKDNFLWNIISLVSSTKETLSSFSIFYFKIIHVNPLPPTAVPEEPVIK